MNDLLRQRITKLLEALDDEKAYQVLDYAEFLTSKYGQRSEPEGLLAKITATVENTMRTGKLPVQAITGVPRGLSEDIHLSHNIDLALVANLQDSAELLPKDCSAGAGHRHSQLENLGWDVCHAASALRDWR